MPGCDKCGSIIARSKDMDRHQRTEPCQLRHQARIQAAENATLREQLATISAEHQAFKSEIDQIKGELRGKDDLRKIVEKAALRPTTSTNVNKSRNYLQYISPEPIKSSTFRDTLPAIVTAEAVMSGKHRFNKIITTALFEDLTGRSKIVCTDQARKQFSYMDEKSGELISDPSLERLQDLMRKGINYGTLYDEVVEELDFRHGKNDNHTEQAHNILIRAKFGVPFVNHVAKRTYKGAIIQFENEAVDVSN
jgi:hypothetical protein